MKLSENTKKIDNYFDNISADELFNLSINKYNMETFKDNMVHKLDTFVKYCEVVNESDKYGYLYKDENGKLYVETLSKKIIKDIAYQARNPKSYHDIVDRFVRISYATCGAECQIGKPKQTCIDDKIYSPNKCAVVFLEIVDLEKVYYNLSYTQLHELISKLDTPPVLTLVDLKNIILNNIDNFDTFLRENFNFGNVDNNKIDYNKKGTLRIIDNEFISLTLHGCAEIQDHIFISLDDTDDREIIWNGITLYMYQCTDEMD